MGLEIASSRSGNGSRLEHSVAITPRRPYTGHVPRPQEASLIASRFITALPGAWSRGNRSALNQLLPLVYEGRR